MLTLCIQVTLHILKAVVLLLLIYCLMYFPLLVGVLCLSLICYALLFVHSSFAIILERKRKRVAWLLLSYRCLATVNVLWLFFAVPWVGLQCAIVVFPYHTHLLFERIHDVVTLCILEICHGYFEKQCLPRRNDEQRCYITL